MKTNSNLKPPQILWRNGAMTPRLLGKSLYLSPAVLRPLASMAVFARGCCRVDHVGACPPLSPAERALGRPSHFRPSDLSGAAAPSSPGATLHAAHRCGVA